MAPRAGSHGPETNYTKGRFFVDTNLLVYAYDQTAEPKRSISAKVLSALWEHRTGVVSTQVLQELFVALTRKVARPLPVDIVEGIVSDFLGWRLVVNDGKAILRAIDIQKRLGLSFWDSLIVQAAVFARAHTLLTEDLQNGQVIDGVTIVNPFLAP